VGDRALLAGGPLTITPGLAQSALRRAVLGALDAVLRAWWSVARLLVR